MDNSEIIPLLAVAQTTDPLTLQFTILGRWASSMVTYEVCTDLIKDVNGFFIVDPKCAQFAGMPQFSSNMVRDLIDVRNPQVEQTVVNGALVVQTNGDYELEGGLTLLKKLVIRRILTVRGEFLHLPEYGLGVPPKDLLRNVDLVSLRRAVDEQVLREPEIAAVRSVVELNNDGRLDIRLRAKLAGSGTSFDLSVPLLTTTETT